LDIYSRKIVGWEIHAEESAQNAAKLIRKAHLREEVQDKPLVLHSDNGGPMKGSSMLEKFNYKLMYFLLISQSSNSEVWKLTSKLFHRLSSCHEKKYFLRN
jgi:transposase InsO family protein